jgi:Ca2+:H+ antiporter
VVLTFAVHEPGPPRAELDGLHRADEDRVVARLVLGDGFAFEPAERAVDQRAPFAVAHVDPVPEGDRWDAAAREVLSHPGLVSREEARGPAACTPDRLVRGGLLADRDPDQGRLEGEGDERPDRQTESLGLDLGRHDGDGRGKPAHHLPQLVARHCVDDMAVTRRDGIELGVAGSLVVAAGVAHFADATPVLAFAVAALAIAVLARLVGGATEQLGSRVGSSVAGVIQSALGNLPELFIVLFALREGLTGVVQAALVGSVIANSVLVLGIAFVAGGVRHGTQVFNSPRARMIATLTAMAAAILALPTLAHAFHTPAAAHEKSLSLICAGVLLVLFFLTLPGFLAGGEEASAVPARWKLGTTVVVLALAGTSAALVSDWFVSALKPATEAIGMSEAFAGLVVVAIAGNAVENVVGVRFASQNRPDFAISVIVNSALQVALLLTPIIVFASLFFATSLTLVFPTLLAIVLLLAAGICALVVYDGESTWEEGAILIGLYVVIAASFWWGA